MLCKFWDVTNCWSEPDLRLIMTIFSHEMIFWWILQKLVTDQSSTYSLAQSFDNSLVSVWKKGIGTNPHVANRILSKAAGLSWLPVQEEGVSAQISNEQHSHFRCLHTLPHKSLVTISFQMSTENLNFRVFNISSWRHLQNFQKCFSLLASCIIWTNELYYLKKVKLLIHWSATI